MKSRIGIGYSGLSNVIYAGRVKEHKEGVMRFVGERDDVTYEALYAVIGLLKDTGNSRKVGKYTINYTIEEEK